MHSASKEVPITVGDEAKEHVLSILMGKVPMLYEAAGDSEECRRQREMFSEYLSRDIVEKNRLLINDGALAKSQSCDRLSRAVKG